MNEPTHNLTIDFDFENPDTVLVATRIPNGSGTENRIEMAVSSHMRTFPTVPRSLLPVR